jgi:dipeptidyl aminopeptidase/acylaminoacyl peptidase
MKTRALPLCVPIALLALACGGSNATQPGAPTPKAAASGAVPVSTTLPAPAPPRSDASLIPRSVIFGNPEKTSATISPDGTKLAFLAATEGVLNVWVSPLDDLSKASPVTHDKARPVFQFWWSQSSGQILYAQDAAGDENWHIYAVTLATGVAMDLTPYKGAQANLEALPTKHPGEALVAINDRDPKYHDRYRIDLKTGVRTLVQKNDGGFAGFVIDDDFNVKLAAKAMPDGSSTYFAPGPKKAFDATYMTIPFDDSLATIVFGLDDKGSTLYMLDSRERDTAGLFAVDLATKKATLLAEDPKADVESVFPDPVTHRPLAAVVDYDRQRHVILDPRLQPDQAYLETVVPGADFTMSSCSNDMKRCIVAFDVSDGPVRFYRYDRVARKADFLFSHRPKLEGLKLAKMTSVVIKARDGLDLVSYLSLPAASDPDGNGKPDHALPMVLVVHGGPWGRDTWGFNRLHQWLANRGYAVLSVNFRGSTGFGKQFINAGNGEWSGKMHDDLIDTVTWAQQNGIADPRKTAIFGGSYGGYSTLVGMTFTPDTFACGVDEFGPSNLVTLGNAIPPYWAPFIEQFARRVGDYRTDAGRQGLMARSPLTRAAAIKKPLLIGQGANDVRVKQAESDQIVKAMQAKGIPVTYVVFSDEGHGFARPENNTAFNAVAETFLAQCLGGGYQPVDGDFAGSTIAVPAGADQVFGVSDALKSKPAAQN